MVLRHCFGHIILKQGNLAVLPRPAAVAGHTSLADWLHDEMCKRRPEMAKEKCHAR